MPKRCAIHVSPSKHFRLKEKRELSADYAEQQNIHRKKKQEQNPLKRKRALQMHWEDISHTNPYKSKNESSCFMRRQQS